LLLENLRFKEEEKMNCFRKTPAQVAIYSNDAFGTAHRAHASTACSSLFEENVAG
jgi:3-phosphoglycerate kinase